jgi:hypothetical protein
MPTANPTTNKRITPLISAHSIIRGRPHAIAPLFFAKERLCDRIIVRDRCRRRLRNSRAGDRS